MKTNLVSLIFIFLGMAAKAQEPHVSSGKIQRLSNFKSNYVDSRNIDIWLPDGYSPNEKYAVVYMHDGQSLFDADITWNKQEWDADGTAAKLIADGKTQKFIVVGIWNNGMKRHFEYFPQKAFAKLTKEQQEFVSGQLLSEKKIKEPFNPCSDNYLKFVVTELKPYIDSNFSTRTDAAHTFIAGSSMGGLISMYAICEYPEVFGGAACLSTHWPGIFKAENNPVPAVFFDYLKNHLPGPKNHKFYFDYGDQTLDALYPNLQKQVDVIMKEKGYSGKNWITRFFPGENHSEDAWKKRLNIPFEFLLKP